MKALLYALLPLLIFTATDYNSSPEKELHKQLIGKWRFASKTGGTNGLPEALKLSTVNSIEFKSGGKYVRYTNGEPMYQGNYKLSKAKCINTGKLNNSILFDPRVNSSETGSILTITGDSLLLADNVEGGYTKGYTREN